jgi:hypothetical protein
MTLLRKLHKEGKRKKFICRRQSILRAENSLVPLLVFYASKSAVQFSFFGDFLIVQHVLGKGKTEGSDGSLTILLPSDFLKS